MSILSAGKRLVELAPPSVGKLLAHVPYSVRLGGAYGGARNDLKHFATLDNPSIRANILQRVRSIARHAVATTAFYRDLYGNAGVDPDMLRDFEDIQTLPIVSKGDLQATPIEMRSSPSRGAMRINTGGTSGTPLEFYIDRHAFAREWPHMLDIWQRVGYRPSCLKLTFRGKNLGSDPVRYNAVHNEYQVNAYCPMRDKAVGVAKIKQPIKFLHGYPSAIYEFIRYCRESAPDALARLRASVRGVLLGSEYPAPVYRDLIESELDAPSVSWYGHSEFAILAGECEPFLYRPFHSYGFCEAIPDGEGSYRLVATSYFNTASPFIRYDTGDRIEPIMCDGLVSAFRVTSGRVGECIEDASGNRISLTALIFGRHHSIFGTARFVQVQQNAPGAATLIITLPTGLRMSEQEALSRFDTSGVAIHFTVELREEPIRTKAGKVPLLVKNSNWVASSI